MARAKTHPLKAWRLTQNRVDHATKKSRAMTIREAAGGVGVPYQTWYAWEHWPDEGGRIPDRDSMMKVHAFTKGQVRPDHFYDLASRADRAAASGNGAMPAGAPL